MTGRPASPPAADDAAPADEQYAQAYAEGYGEGLREALREVLSHLSRGHTVGELRVLVQSRLARWHEDVELKRKSLLAPPRRTPWGTMLRPPAAPAEEPLGVVRGAAVLFLEDRPHRAVAFVGRAAAQYAQVVCISTHPPSFPDPAAKKLLPLRLALPTPGMGAAEGELDPGGLGGRVREATEGPGGALVYLDAVEVMSTEYSLETTLKFVNWVAAQVARTGAAFVACVDPGALEARDLRRLQRSFNIVR